MASTVSENHSTISIPQQVQNSTNLEKREMSDLSLDYCENTDTNNNNFYQKRTRDKHKDNHCLAYKYLDRNKILKKDISVLDDAFYMLEERALPSKIRKTLFFSYRRLLVSRRRRVCAWYSSLLIIGLFIILILADLELRIDDPNIIAQNSFNIKTANKAISFLKPIVTITTIFAMLLSIAFHYNEIQIFKFDNNLSVDKVYFNYKELVWIIIELVIIGLHPIYDFNNNSVKFTNLDSWYGPCVEILYFVPCLRIFYALRGLVVRHELFYSTKVQTVANLNRFSIGKISYENVRLIVRSLMESSAVKILTYVVVFNWFFVANLIRLAEYQWLLRELNDFSGDEDPLTNPMPSNDLTSITECLWLVPITFTTIGYGDVSPESSAGRVFAVWLGLLGALCTSIMVGIMSDKLTMNRREKMMYGTLNRAALRQNIKEKAAIVIQRTWRASQKGFNKKKKVLESPGAFIQEALNSDIEKQNKPISETIQERLQAGHLGYCPIVHSNNVLDAIRDFSLIRNKQVFGKDESQTDLVDLAMGFTTLQANVGDLSERIIAMQDQMQNLIKELEVRNYQIKDAKDKKKE